MLFVSLGARSSVLSQKLSALRHSAAGVPFASSSSSCVKLLINAVGLDRLGIVSDVTGKVIEAGGNVGESQAAKLGSHFSLMMLVTVPHDQVDPFRTSLQSMPDMNTSIFETPESVEESTPQQQVGYAANFTLKGADHPGIVHTMTLALAKHGLSIDQMVTDTEIAPHGGTVLFKMQGIATAAAPLSRGFNANAIQESMIDLGDSLNVEVSMEEDSSAAVMVGG